MCYWFCPDIQIPGLLRVVKQFVHIPVYSMIRPRGGDFLYSDREVEVMKVDIELMKSNGADGLVLGVLTEDGRIDTELCVELLCKSLGSGCVLCHERASSHSYYFM